MKPVYIGIRRMIDEEDESTTFFVEVYEKEGNSAGELLVKYEKSFHDEALQLAEFGLSEQYEIESIHYVFGNEKINVQQQKPIFKPTIIQYQIDIIEFGENLKKWLRMEKGWNLSFHFSSEGADDAGYLGSLYFEVNEDNVDEETMDEITEWYGVRDVDMAFHQMLQEMFDCHDVTYDFNPMTEEIYVSVPYQKKERV